MKKRIFIVLFLAFLVAFVNSHATDASFYYGTWLHARATKNAFFSMEMFHLFEDGSGYYSMRTVEDGAIESDPLDLIIEWETADAGIIIQFPSGFRKLYELQQGGILVENDSTVTRHFYKVFPLEKEEKTDAPKIIPGNLQDGYLLYPGQYIIGEDIPAGNYRFEYYEAPCDIFVHKDPESSAWSGYAAVSKNSPVFAKLNLPEGGRVDIGAFPVIIMKYKPLEIGE